MRGYYVDFSRTFTAGYGMPGFEATEKQKKHYKLALEIGGEVEKWGWMDLQVMSLRSIVTMFQANIE